jgi:hypothetical protein
MSNTVDPATLSQHTRSIVKSAVTFRDAEQDLWRAVQDARAAGVPWQTIANVLCVSRQAAQRRFSKPWLESAHK